MKSEIRLLGIDDGHFSFNQKTCLIVGAIMRGGAYLECILRNNVTTDGSDATDICRDMIVNTRYKEQLKAIFIDGVCLAGFNIIDIQKLYSETKIPIITITRNKPDYNAIKQALKKHFADWEQRYQLIIKNPLQKIKTSHNPLFIHHVGITSPEAEEIITLSTIRGVIPEPLRIAHVIASGITRGESHGKA